MIRFDCPYCGKGIAVKDELAGRKGKCPGCGEKLQVPGTTTTQQSVQPKAKEEPPLQIPVQQPSAPVPQVKVDAVSKHQTSAVIQPTPTTAVQVNVQQQSRAAHSLGISSLVIGIFSFFVCWIPFVSMPLNGLGLVLGGVGLILAVVRKGTGIGYSIAGIAVNSIGLLLGFIYIFSIASAFQLVDEAMDDIAAKNTPKQAQAVDSTQPASTQPTPTGPAWTKADIPLQLGSIQLRITEVVIGKVPLINFSNDETSSQNELLALRVKVTNTNERKKVDYQGWMSDYASLLEIDAELTDDAGNRYRAIDFGLRKVKDAETKTSIYPGKSVNDVIVFELPIERIEYLRLKLAAKGCKEEGEFRFEIPKDMIQRR